MYLARGLAAWILIMFAESVHGTIRQIYLAPALGDFAARQVAVFTGMLLIFLIALGTVRWIGAVTTPDLFVVGAVWAVLTLGFEFGIGYFVLGYTLERLIEDYDISRGGLMGLGIAFMALAPYVAATVRGIRRTAL